LGTTNKEDEMDKLKLKIKYWRNRMMDKLVSQTKQRFLDLDEILSIIKFLEVDDKVFLEEIKNINKAYIELEKAVMSIKLKDEIK